MTGFASDSDVQSDTFGLRRIGSSFFGIPGFLVGLGSKGSSDSVSVWSPTSPLDLRGFVNLSNPFSARSSKCSSQKCHGKMLSCSKAGLGIINSLAEENKSTDDVIDLLKRKTIIFGPQVNVNTLTFYNEPVYTSMKSNSLPRNHIVPPFLLTKIPNLHFGSSNGDLEQEDAHLESEPFKSSAPCFPDSTRPSSSLTGSAENQNLSSKTIYSAERTTTRSAPVVIDRGLQVETYSGPKSSSLPISIGTGQGYVGSLSSREIELSEEYTCIISHGPNPRTTHIFGDCVFECPVPELANFDKQGVETPQVAKPLECLTCYPFDDFLSFCYSCKKEFEKGKDIYMYRGEKAFCSFDCRTKEILAEEEEEKCNNSSHSSPGSSCSEDFFIM
ncbi:hypothetical protein ACOSQ4_020918 [Xanthoceras sorbifolium]